MASRRQYWPAVAVLIVGALLTAGLTVLAAELNRSNESHLLHLRTREVAGALTAALPQTETPLGAAAAVGDATNGDPASFRRFAAPYVGAGRPFTSLSLWRSRQIGAGPIAYAGAPPELRPGRPGTAAFFAAADSRGGLSVTGLLRGADPRLGYAYSGRRAGRFLAYGEGALPRTRYLRLPAESAYSNLNFALYLGMTTDPSQLVLASVHRLPLAGHVDHSSVPFGNRFLTVVVSASQPLGGPLPARVVWAIAIAGALFTIAATLLIARLIAGRRRAQGLADENERLFAEQRTIAQTLQRALLPDLLPDVGGIEIAARYETGVSGIEVGGDWYDVIVLDDRRLLMVVGDVSGRGLRAATTMASLRFAIRYAAQISPPEVFLPRLSADHQLNRDDQLATVLCAVIDLEAQTVTVTSAGHLPPLMVANGHSKYLETTVGAPIGIAGDVRYVPTTHPIPPGATLLAYTDGLVERRDEPLDDGLDRLRRAATRADGTLNEVMSQVLDALRTGDSVDDTAIMGIRWAR